MRSVFVGRIGGRRKEMRGMESGDGNLIGGIIVGGIIVVGVGMVILRSVEIVNLFLVMIVWLVLIGRKSGLMRRKSRYV